MSDLFIGDAPVIHALNDGPYIDPVVDGEVKRCGTVPRDWDVQPQRVGDLDIPEIPESEWASRCAELKASAGRLSDLRKVAKGGQPAPSLDQNGKGYCWAHSVVHAVMLDRMVRNEKYVPLSAYAVACVIKSFRDEGGWGALAMDFAVSRGVPSQEKWPQQSMSRSHDNPQTWEDAARYKVTEAWADLSTRVYDRNLTRKQTASLLLSAIPVVCDYNWWGHSVCGMDLVPDAEARVELRSYTGKLLSFEEFRRAWSLDESFGGFGVRIWNSWGDRWGEAGEGVLAPSKAWPDGAVAPRCGRAA